jgi:prepilin-type N-terminal cleavage/methylation domain-containing protein
MRRANQAGFTLPELLVTTLVLLALSVGTFMLLREKPQTVVRDDAQRQVDTALLVQAISNYRSKNNALPAGITTTFQTIGSQDKELDLCKILVPKYLTDLPYDPTTGALASVDERCNAKDQEYTTGYQVKKSQNGAQIIVQAPHTESQGIISITKNY